MMIEICAANFTSALAAQRAGASRIELCAALDAGGLTPSPGLIRRVRQQVSLPIHVLIRPREGDFCYSDAEVAIMLEDIAFCRQEQVDGVVIGALDAQGGLDVPVLRALLAAAGPLDTTFHRAFDCAATEAAEMLEQIIQLGFHRLLTSGREATAWEGRFLIKALVAQAAGRLAVMPGAGISSENIREISRVTGAQEFHLSARRKVIAGNEGLTLPGLDAGWWASDEAEIRQVLSQIK